MNRRTFLATLPLAAAGCDTLLTEDRINLLCEAAAFNGTYIRLTNHPDDLPRFVLVREDLARQLAAGVFDPGIFAATLQALPVPALQSHSATLIIATVIVLLDGQTTIKLASAPRVRSALMGVIEGMDAAFNRVTPP